MKKRNEMKKEELIILAKEGNVIMYLPDCGKCDRSGKNPNDMTACPNGNKVCIPKICNHYSENY